MPKKLWFLLIGMILNVTGNSFLWPFNVVYIHTYLGKSLSVAGLILMFNSLAGVFGNMLGGWLFDKLGGYRSILTGISITFLSILGLVINHSWTFYSCFFVVLGFGVGIVFPSMYAMVGAAWPEGGRKAFNAIYVAQNLGVAIGTALGGMVADFNINYIFSANLLLYIVFFLVALFGFRDIGVPKVVNEIQVAQSEKQKFSFTPSVKALMIVCCAYVLCWLVYVQWQTTIASEMQNLHIGLKKYSLLWTINGALIVVAQPIISSAIRKYKLSMRKQMLFGIGFFIASTIFVSTAHQFSMFITGMIILTIGEMFVWPAVPTIANMLAPKDRVGMYQGIVNSAATVGRMLGPVIGGAVVDTFNMRVLFIVLVVFLGISMIFSVLYERLAKKVVKAENQTFAS
ncbi:MFS transporter [Bacillus sp. AFS002410]|uniref:MDR family MFS transporter n=1 Tax=Bacillus sp. AFS002410 TaxID=2033481 RepID=UPI000BF01774|nr:MFS transporter [Bacillus sp. AFS002410]PEJ57544.1 MFS transporter [Bacillus sp. AFS002410]